METAPITREMFLAAYEAALIAEYEWAARWPERRARFMASTERTMRGPSTEWQHGGNAVHSAWRALGGKGVPTLKALRALPEA